MRWVVSTFPNLFHTEAYCISLVYFCRSQETWTLYPQVNGYNFSGPEMLTISPNGVSQYEVSYSPMLMTKESQHSVSFLLFFFKY